MSNKRTLCTKEFCQMDKLPTDSESLATDFERYLTRHLGRFIGCIPFYLYEAFSLTVRDHIMTDWRNTWKEHEKKGVKKAYYMSLEFLIGRSLGNHLLNLDIENESKEAMNIFALALEDIISQEHDAGLGNGGLGRLAACFMDSCATLTLPVIGYGIRYEYGMFRQIIKDGYQIEEPDHWLRNGNPWELERPEYTQVIKFGGHIEMVTNHNRKPHVVWVGTSDVLAIPYDVPISGYKNNVVNTLRLWSASTTNIFNLDEFNAGSYSEAVEVKNDAEHISMVLYPNDASENGKELRLKQQYFLASASLQDVLRMWSVNENNDFSHFAQQNVFQLNDTHPTIAVAELMRLLIDEHYLSWDEAWDITSQTMAYTNHTLLPEALEKWPVSLFECLLPRLLQIIYEINACFLKAVSAKWPGDTEKQISMSIIEEGEVQYVRMAYLAIVGSFSVNGVAALHSKLLSEGLFKNFYELWPHKFNNKTNGVTPRRWVAHANPLMTQLISEKIGDNWVRNLDEINSIKQYIDEPDFCKQWFNVKLENKKKLAELVKTQCDVDFNVNSLFDVQVKRIHEYKRQLLNILHVIHLYNRIKRNDTVNWTNRCVLIGGKAAPGYQLAKSIIKLTNNIANVINNDSDVGDKLKLAFMPNYGVSKMQIICPATDLSEQISTAGKEASGTGNMKFMMNGAVTIGTYDGANIEILDAVGNDNFFLFGLNAEEVEQQKKGYYPSQLVENDEDLKQVMHLLGCGHFNSFEYGIFDDIIASLLNPYDPWLTLADFRSYIDTQEKVSLAYREQDSWVKMSIMNTASSGFFSTDRTMQEYNRDIWKLNSD
ncbi:MAG: glycogen/starch/alpha-glucan phosphorylase [Gammaproteobacteria bacterium]|nr:glycogen/starch/alpha-glucan phosphorylase [Gammaproteobacteria bacterium]MCW8986232.1 glycogen/starch/alpha-glucan phosphorylase [Gammaproteobacteria bacterium]MCW9031475.1 glycogen/starch/alpha-glucan phosphorylase [Gammaproteobacteria bacterium]